MSCFWRAVTEHDLQEMFFFSSETKGSLLNIFIILTDNFPCPIKNTFAQAVSVRTEYLRGKCQEVLPDQN